MRSTIDIGACVVHPVSINSYVIANSLCSFVTRHAYNLFCACELLFEEALPTSLPPEICQFLFIVYIHRLKLDTLVQAMTNTLCM